MKSYTDLEQSKKLSEILPHESADMRFCFSSTLGGRITGHYPMIGREPSMGTIPCWSLAVLLDILSKQDFIIKSSERNNKCQYNIDIPIRHCKVWFSSLLDAAFEMICWLKENNKL